MSGTTLTIQPVEPGDLPALFVYLDDHLQDNGKNGMPLFQPMPRRESFFPASRKAAVATGLISPVGAPHWRRAWIALDADGAIAGHVDVRGRPEKAAAHRALLGMGVHRDYRRQGLGKRLLQVAQDWALQEPTLDWLDLEVIATNLPGRALYLAHGFHVTGETADMFRIDGERLGYTYMTLGLR